MNAFNAAWAQDAEREYFVGDVSTAADRQKRDGSIVRGIGVTAEQVDERIEHNGNEDGVLRVLRVVAPIEHLPELEEGWTYAGLRYAVKRIVERSPAWATFEAERWEPLRKHDRSTYEE